MRYKVIKLVVTSNIYQQNREIIVMLPDDFSSKKQYDVYLVFDANDLIMNELNIQTKMPISSVFIGFSSANNYVRFNELATYCNSEVKKLEEKYALNSFDVKYSSTVGGSGLKTNNFLSLEVIPFVLKTYDFSIKTLNLLGCSLGAYFALQLLYLSQLVFNKILIFSPSIWFNYAIINDLEKLQLNHSKPVTINLWVGLKEPHLFEKTIAIDYYQDALLVNKTLEQHNNITCNFVVSENGNHSFKAWITFLHNNSYWWTN